MLRNEAGGIKGRVPYIALGTCDVSTEFWQLIKREIFSTTLKLWSDQIIMKLRYLKRRIWVLGFVLIGSYNLFSDSLIFFKKSKVILIPNVKAYLGITVGVTMEREILLLFKDQNKQVKRTQYTKRSVGTSRHKGWLTQLKFNTCNPYPASSLSNYSSALGASLIYTSTQIYTPSMYRLSKPTLCLIICSFFKPLEHLHCCLNRV